MDSQRLQKAEAVFHRLAELPPDERADSLTELCDGDGELRRFVERLLAHDDHGMSDFLEPAAPIRAKVALARANDHIPTKIGRYRVLARVAEGGMGIVYKAEQDHPHRNVAMKVIRTGLATRRLLQRFEHEAEVLGRLQHPGIARIYEAGTADLGLGRQPYFAMEWIDGAPLNAFADARQLDVRGHLTLVADVCDAVEHAHQKGVIHRDLKPGNILVDEGGQPKILDFGVARATDADIQTTTLQTEIGELLGTVPYMSPEQVRGDPNDIDTRADVYALGVIGYELLVGRLPHDVARKSIAEVVRIIETEEPLSLATINPQFRGDIETIITTAMDKDRARRYASAGALGADIRRYLNDEPILARPMTAWYQLKKLARRRRALVGGIAVAVGAITIGLTLAVAGWLQAHRRALETEEARQAAVAETARAQATSRFLRNTLLMVDPDLSARPGFTYREAIDRAAEKIVGLREHPLVEAEVCATIGFTYRRLGNFEKAEPLLRRALAIRELELGENDVAAAVSRHQLAQLILAYYGDLKQGEALIRDAANVFRQNTLNEYPEELYLPFALNDLGVILRIQGRLDEAETHLRESIDLAFRSNEDREKNIAAPRPMKSLAELLIDRGELDAADVICREALDICQRVTLGQAPHIAKLLHVEGLIRYRKGDLAEAEKLIRQALAEQRRLWGNNHPLVAESLQSLAEILLDAERFGEAETLARECLNIRRHLLHRSHPLTATAADLVIQCQQRGGS